MSRRRLQLATAWRPLAAALVLLVSASPAAFAADVVKANNADALNLPSSWTGGVLPTSADVAVWNSTVTTANAPLLGGSLSWQGIRIANPGGAITIANSTGATLTLGLSGIDMSSATQNLTLNPNLEIGANQTWAVNGGRTLTGIAGTTTSVGTGGGNILMSQSGAGTATIIFNQNGNGTGWSGYSGNVTVNANVKLQSQGNAAAALGSGTVTLAGGQLAQAAGNWTFGNNINITAASVIGNDSSSGVGRTLKLLGDLTSANSSGLTFTNNVTGGTRTDNVGFLLAGAGVSTYGTTTISANSRVRVGGTATASIASPGSDAGTRGSLGSGAVTLSAATSELAFTRSDAHTVANNISGSGTVVIGGNTTELTGTGTQVVTLSGTNTYTGSTRVSRSRLNLTGTMTSAITVDNSGLISGTGSTTGLLTLSSGSGLALAGGATTTSLTLNGATFGGSNVVRFLTEAVPGTVYDVFTYGTGAVTNPGNLTVGWRGTLSNDTVNQKYVFTAGSVGTRTWNTTTGTWEVGGVTSNWSGGDGLYYNGDTAVFDEPAASSTVTLSGAILPGAVQVNNTTNAYTFTGAAIAGTGSLAKSGAGSLSLATGNTYTGGTTLSAGTLVLGNANAISTGALTITGGSLDSSVANLVNAGNNPQNWNGDFSFIGTQNLNLGTGAVTLSASRQVTVSTNALTVAGVIAGSGFGLTKAGPGVLTLTNANTYSGGTTLTAGTLRVGNNAALGGGTATLNGGTLSSDSGTTRTFANAIAIGSNVTFGDGTNGGQLVFDGAVNLQGGTRTLTSVLGTQGARFNGVVSNGGITIAGTGRITLVNDSIENPNTFSGPTTINSGLLATSLNALSSSASVTIGASGTLAIGSNGTTTINNLSGVAGATILSSFNITADGARTLQITQSVDGTYAGSISQGSARVIALTKTGPAMLTISASTNNASGAFAVNEGTLRLGSAVALGTTASGTTVAPGAVLDLNGQAIGAEPLALAGTGVSAAGALVNSSSSAASYGGAITLASGSSIGGTGNITLSGGVAGGAAALTKVGPNTLTLSGTNAYTGATTIAAGTFALGSGSSLASAVIDVASGGRLDVSALASGLSLGAGQRLGGRGTLVGNVTFGTGSQLAFDPAGPLVVGSGTLAFAAGFGIANLFGVDWDGLNLSTPYTVVDTGQSFTAGDIGNFGFANRVAVGSTGREAYFQTGSLQFVIVPEPGTLAVGLASLGILGWAARRRR